MSLVIGSNGSHTAISENVLAEQAHVPGLQHVVA